MCCGAVRYFNWERVPISFRFGSALFIITNILPSKKFTLVAVLCCVPRKFAVAKDPLLSYTLQGIPAVTHKHTIQTKQKPFILKLTTQYNPTSHLTLITTSSSTRIKCQTFSVATIERNSKLWASASRLIQHNSTSFS